MPHSVLLLDVRPNGIACELQLPLGQLEMAWGVDLHSNPAGMVERFGPRLSEYIRAHLRPIADNGKPWRVTIDGMELKKAEQTETGPYREITMQLWLEPPLGTSTRHFTLYYDAIIHQVVTHRALVAIRRDWDNGAVGGTESEVGVFEIDPRDNSIPPLVIGLDQGSLWRGFWRMLNLGIEHIGGGTDHLLFLIVLLLPAPLLVRDRRWGTFGGARYSLVRLLKITGAFTIGHSITLLAGAVGWLRLPSQPVEILIAVSILVTAIHAIKPIFAGGEVYIAAGFGLVHGLAFAGMLADLHLEPGRMALSILGFNLGIELMQIFVVLMTVPWLIVLSTTALYPWIRWGGAVLAAAAAIAWIVERIGGRPNVISALVAQAAANGRWLVLGLAIMAVLSMLGRRFNTHSSIEEGTRNQEVCESRSEG